jgi:hypothetical protein
MIVQKRPAGGRKQLETAHWAARLNILGHHELVLERTRAGKSEMTSGV